MSTRKINKIAQTVVVMEKLSPRVYNIVQAVYNRALRPRLPRTDGWRNGVRVPDINTVLDVTQDNDEYEADLIDVMDADLRAGDRAVIVGGGWGVTAVRAARECGDVQVFEGAREYVDRVRATAAANDVLDEVHVSHASVGGARDVWGEAGPSVSPSELPACDYLEIDAEGVEKDIIEQLDQDPRVIAVETHPDMGIDPAAIRSLLEERGYDVRRVATDEEYPVLGAVKS